MKLFHTDFENEVINEAPVSVFAFGTNSATTDDIIIRSRTALNVPIY